MNLAKINLNPHKAVLSHANKKVAYWYVNIEIIQNNVLIASRKRRFNKKLINNQKYSVVNEKKYTIIEKIYNRENKTLKFKVK